MIKQTWNISEDEKNRILNLHESATKRMYLSEQEKEEEIDDSFYKLGSEFYFKINQNYLYSLADSTAGQQWTYVNGKRVDSTFLHLREWLSVVRNGGTLSCGIDEGFDEAISAHMAGISYKTGRRIEWDTEKEIIKPIEGINFDEVLIS